MPQELQEQLESTPFEFEASVSEDEGHEINTSQDNMNDDDKTRLNSSHDEEEEDESSDETEDRELCWRIDNIDRLSLLPNELLDEIFDLAHPLHYPPRRPLSKRLKPFYDFVLYRRIAPRSARQLQRLIRKVNAKSHLAQRIEEFNVDYLYDLHSFTANVTPAEVALFYSNLTSAKEIDFSNQHPRGRIFRPFADVSSLPALPLLKRLVTVSSSVSRDPLRIYTSFSQLRSLTVTNYEVDHDPAPVAPNSQLPLLVELSIQGEGADDESVATFCRSCPSLSSLTLSTHHPRYTAIIPKLPKGLTALILLNENHASNQTGYFCDHLLHRFEDLRHLELDNHLFSQRLAEHLLNNGQQLQTLKLGNGWISASDLIDYFQGPSSSLEHLDLDLVRIWPGWQCVEEHTEVVDASDIPEDEDYFNWGDWWQGLFEPGNGDKVEDACDLLNAAEEAGVEVKGTLEVAIETYWLYLVEISNITILRTYRDQDFDHYETVRDDPDLNVCLPQLDLDNLDVDNLQLLRKYSYDHDCYYLTLQNKPDGTETDADEERVTLADFGDGKGPR